MMRVQNRGLFPLLFAYKLQPLGLISIQGAFIGTCVLHLFVLYVGDRQRLARAVSAVAQAVSISLNLSQ